MSNTTLLLIAIGAIMLAALPVAALFKNMLPELIERSSGLDSLENRIYVLHAEVHEMQNRVAGLTVRRNQQSSEKHRVESDIRKMEKAIRGLAEQPPLFVHEIGEPAGNTTKFTVSVTQERASAQARAAGERAPVNAIWRHANIAEVWASSYEEAKQIVETAFPFKLGYQKAFQKNSDQLDRRVAEAKARAETEAGKVDRP